MRPAPAIPAWTALSAGAGGAGLSVVAVGLGPGAVAAYGTAQGRSALWAAVAWLGTGA